MRHATLYFLTSPGPNPEEQKRSHDICSEVKPSMYVIPTSFLEEAEEVMKEVTS